VGKITLKGEIMSRKPLGALLVVLTFLVLFHQGEDQFIGAKIKEGAYRMTRVPTGKYVVSVEAKDVPPRYASESSALRVEVHSGMNEFLFNLTSN
jgi:hypothetical protein